MEFAQTRTTKGSRTYVRRAAEVGVQNAEEARSDGVRLDVPLREALGRIRTGNRSFAIGVLCPLSYKGTGSLRTLHLVADSPASIAVASQIDADQQPSG